MNLFRGYGMKNLGRFGTITRVLIKHGLGDVAERLSRKKPAHSKDSSEKEPLVYRGFPSPKRIRLVFEELGPSFIKLGQLMSTRADIFPPEYIEEFKKLQDQVPPEPLKDIVAVIEDELKHPISELFKTFSSESIAAASVAQVHVAELFSGEKVAVKVIRPGIRKKIEKDIRLMDAFAERIERSFEVGRIIGVANLVKEFERTIFKELDMFIEAGTIEKFSVNFKDDDELYIPKVYWNLTSRSVLVMEHIDGIKMDRIDTLKAHGIDPKEIAMIGLRSFSRQLMEFGIFHADPHPANAIVMYDGRVSLVDFGIIGYLDEEMMHQIANIFLGYAEHDYSLVMEALLDAGLLDDETMDIEGFRLDLKDISEPFYGRSLQTISVKDVYDQVMHLVLKYRIRLPRNMLLLLKTFIQTEALGKILGSDASLLEVTRPYAKRLIQKGYEAQKLMRLIRKDARYIGKQIKELPRYVHDILRQTARGRQRIEIRHSGFERFDQKLEKGVNRLTVGLIISASIIAGSLVLNSGQKVIELQLNLFGFQKVPLTALLGLAGYSIATVLGIWLIFSIFRSGKM
ncbi:MAG: AarF/ABC1/UbiB kinase family protein [Desulfobacterales bacterium]|nr:AarF/ABC1/UbiB kinase family protein [Desulfobacterales bacterium]